jgi:hypothetical protein
MDREEMRKRLRKKLEEKKNLRKTTVVEKKEPVVEPVEPVEPVETVESTPIPDPDFSLNEDMLKKFSENADIKKIVENVSQNSELMDIIANEIKNPDKIKNIIGELSKNKSLFNESLLTNPEILKQASDPNMIKEALKILKENPESLRNMLNGSF